MFIVILLMVCLLVDLMFGICLLWVSCGVNCYFVVWVVVLR